MHNRKPPLETGQLLFSHLPSRAKLPGNTTRSVSVQFLMLWNSAGLEKAQGIKNKALNGNDNTWEKKDTLFSAQRPTLGV